MTETTGDFGMHERFGRRRNRHVRLTRAALVLLAAALASWLIGLPGWWPAAISGLLSFAALVWPVQGSNAWALEYIGSQTGLSYETALALELQPRDPFGLGSQVRSRARSSIAGLDEPKWNEWWLAAFILAVGILLLPLLRLDLPWSGSPDAPPPLTDVIPPAVDGDPDAEQEEDGQPEGAEVTEDELPLQAPTQPPGTQEPSEPAAAESPAGERESEVLDRFLDNLRERPREPAADMELPGTPVPADSDTPAEQGEDETDGTAPLDDSPEEASRDESGDDTGAREAGDDGLQESTDDQTDPAETDGEQGDPEADTEQAGDSEAGLETSPDPGGIESVSAGEDGGDSAGAGAGRESILSEEERLGAEGEEELLEGQLVSDDVNIGGDVRLPGFSDVELPPDSSPARLGEALERSLTGGHVPLEYQEIIRDYFR